ncbi:cytochrome P450 [Sorangium sp. So ce429]
MSSHSAAGSDLGRGFNPFEPGFARDPFAFYAQARREAPVCYSPLFDFWLVTGASEIVEITRDPARFSSVHNMTPVIPLAPEAEALLEQGFDVFRTQGLINNDPPTHTRVRALFSQAFTPRRIALLEPMVRAVTDELVDGLVKDGGADMVAQLAYPLPIRVIGDMMGIPRADLPQMKAWTDDFMFLLGGNEPPERRLERVRGILSYGRYCQAMIEERRRSPRDDLTTAMVEARVDGESFTTAEIVQQMVILFVAGHETTTNALGTALFSLLQQPEVWRGLGGEPGLFLAAFEEAVRFHSPVQCEPRTTTTKVELGGASLPEGAKLHLVYAAANRDETVFESPDKFNIHRENPNRHFGFGYGVHFCVGAPLARIEGRIALEVLRARLPNLRLAPDFTPEYDMNLFFRGLKRLPVRWDAP